MFKKLTFISLLNLMFINAIYANQLDSTMQGIQSSLTTVAQSAAGIGLIVGVIIWNLGNSDLGKMICKAAAVGIVVTFLLPNIIQFLKSVGKA